MRISSRIALVGAVPVTISVIIVAVAWYLLGEADTVRQSAVMAGGIYRDALAVEASRAEFHNAVPQVRSGVGDGIDEQTERTRSEIVALSGMVGDEAEALAVRRVWEALELYRKRVDALVAITLDNDRLIASMSVQSNTLIDLTEQARQRQHAANLQVGSSLTEVTRKLQASERVVDLVRRLRFALSDVWRDIAEPTLRGQPLHGIDALNHGNFAAVQVETVARDVIASLDDPAFSEFGEDAVALRHTLEKVGAAARMVATVGDAGPGGVAQALDDLKAIEVEIDRLLKIWIPGQNSVQDELAYLVGYSVDANIVNTGAEDLALAVLRMSRRAADALPRRDVREIEALLNESGGIGGRFAALPISPVIQQGVINAFSAWRANLARARDGLAAQNEDTASVESDARSLIAAARAVNDRFLEDSARASERVRLIIVWGATGCTFLGGIVAFFAALGISRPVRRLQRRMVELAADPAAGAVDDLRRRDELGDMAKALQHFVGTIRERETRLKQANAELSLAQRELERAATIDALTEICNRRKLDEVFAEHVVLAERYDVPLAVIMLDVDKFKLINDTHGHQVGDTVLQELAAVLRGGVRDADWVGRWGGEEFMVICPQTPIDEATTLAERLRRLIATYEFTAVGQLTCSFGLAAYRPGDRGNTIVKRADEALYLAKETGRNRVEREAAAA